MDHKSVNLSLKRKSEEETSPNAKRPKPSDNDLLFPENQPTPQDMFGYSHPNYPNQFDYMRQPFGVPPPAYSQLPPMCPNLPPYGYPNPSYLFGQVYPPFYSNYPSAQMFMPSQETTPNKVRDCKKEEMTESPVTESLKKQELDKQAEPPVPEPIYKETKIETPTKPQASARESVIKANKALNLIAEKRKSSKAFETEGSRVQISTKLDHDKVFCTIPGRLSLLTNTKYDVTVGELVRRVSQPECLNTSLIGGLVRTAKKKDGGDELREKLKKVGIKLASHRHKECPQTSFTALVEREATQLASDFDTIVKKEFPTTECAQKLAKFDESDKMMKDAEKFLEYFSSFLKDEKNVHNLEMLTHNFSVPAMMATVNLMQDVIKEGLSSTDP